MTLSPFDVPPEGGPPLVFGLALDPDLGPDAADDATGYDAGRGLAYVYDGERAIGFLLRDATGADALVSVQQFGLRRHAPSLPREAWAAQREPGVHLLRGVSDVQLVLSAAQRRQAGDWTFVILRAADVATLRSRADAVLAALTAR